jgi:hypothetical protein
MASSYTPLGVQLMVTGEKAGLWGDYTNTNLQILEQIAGGYTTQAVTDGTTTALTVNDGSTGATIATSTIKMTGSLTGASGLSVPDDITGMKYLVINATTGGQTVTFKTAGGTGVSWATTDAKLLYHDGTNIVDSGLGVGDVTLTGTQTLTNKTLTAPKFADGGFIADANGAEALVFGATGSAVNEVKINNAATGSGPTIVPVSTSGTDTNIDLNLNAAGTGVVKSGTAPVKIAGTETMFIPAQAMFGTTTNGAESAAVETTALRPELKVLDFDASTRENAQFSVAMPKSWNLGTVTYQVFWSPSNTDTGNCIFGLEGLATTEGDTADAVFGTAVEVTDAGIGTVEDVQMTAVSGAVTIGGSPADDDYTFFQLYRDAADGSDTFTGDARVMGIKLFYTTDAANDA